MMLGKNLIGLNEFYKYSNLLQSGKFALPITGTEYLASQAETKFNSEIFKEFVNSVYCYPNGLVNLNNSIEGVVILQNKGFLSRSIIGTLENGRPALFGIQIAKLLNGIVTVEKLTFRVLFGYTIPIIAVLFSLWIVYSAWVEDFGEPLSQNRIFARLGGFIVGVPLYFIFKYALKFKLQLLKNKDAA